MSHIRKIEVDLTDLRALKNAFGALGWCLMEKKNIRTYHTDPNKNKKFDFIFENPKNGYDIGVIASDGKYELFADFFDSSIEQQLGRGMSRLFINYNIGAAQNRVNELEDRYEAPTITVLENGFVEVSFEKI